MNLWYGRSRFQSTHPLRGATQIRRAMPQSAKFQSTHPLRGATRPSCGSARPGLISIHAPLAGCDRLPNRAQRRQCHFNPRTPCGVRHWCTDKMFGILRFQSTHPLRGATCEQIAAAGTLPISIHAPLAGCDSHNRRGSAPSTISIHAPLAGCDGVHVFVDVLHAISIHAPLAGTLPPA